MLLYVLFIWKSAGRGLENGIASEPHSLPALALSFLIAATKQSLRPGDCQAALCLLNGAHNCDCGTLPADVFQVLILSLWLPCGQQWCQGQGPRVMLVEATGPGIPEYFASEGLSPFPLPWAEQVLQSLLSFLLPGSGQHPHPREPGPFVPGGAAEGAAGETGPGECHEVQWGPDPPRAHAAPGDQCSSAEAGTAAATTATLSEQDCIQWGAASKASGRCGCAGAGPTGGARR